MTSEERGGRREETRVVRHSCLLPPLFSLFIFLAAFVLYLTTLAPGMLRGDSGEFQWAMASLNVAHATGYPLFTLLGYAWQAVPLSNNIAWQLNLLSPFFAALAAATLFVFIQSVTRNSIAALVGALFFALAPVIWFNASILEVYSLHAFFLALILLLLWQWAHPSTPLRSSQDETRNDAWLYLAFFTLGLALAHHRLIVLALPAIAYFLLATDRRFLFNVPRLLVCALLIVPGLLLYFYVPLRLLPAGFSMDYAVSDIILGREYAGSLLREINPLPVLVQIPFDNFHVGLVLALVGAITLFRRALHLNIALWLIYAIDVVFALVYSVPDVQVFLTSSIVVTAIWIGAGAAFLWFEVCSANHRTYEWVIQRVGPMNARWIGIAVGALLMLAALFNLIHYPDIQTQVANEAAPEARARAIGRANLPQGAFLELDWETATALRFLQATELLRPDLETRLIKVDQRDEFWRTLQNVDTGRAVLVESGVKWTRAPAGYSTEPAGNDLVELVHTPADMTRQRGAISDRVDVVGYQTTPDALVVYWRVNQPIGKDLATFVHYLASNGDKIGQEDHAACCEALYGYRTSEWEVGHIYADMFKPPPNGSVSFLVGMYENANGDIEPYGDTVTIKP